MNGKIMLKLKQNVSNYKLFENIRKKHLTNKGNALENNLDILDDAEYVKINWPKENKKPYVGLVKDFLHYPFTPWIAYWPKYQRYLEHNNIPYEFFNIYSSNWLEKSKKFDIIIWHTESEPAAQWNAKTKIYLLEKHLGKQCHPTFGEVWCYEDKIRQYYLFKINNIPAVDTFISNEREESFGFVESAKYPIVSKIATGSGSSGVELITNKRMARKYIDKVFGSGRGTYWTYLKQKNYVYFQEFISNALYDLRIIIIGNRYFGYFRHRTKNDFRASGSGILEKKAIPKEALLLAKEVKEKLEATTLAVDVIKSEDQGEYKVIEASIFVRVDTAEQLKVDEIAGYYEYCNDDFVFKPGKYWIQELSLNEVMSNWIRNSKK